MPDPTTGYFGLRLPSGMETIDVVADPYCPIERAYFHPDVLDDLVMTSLAIQLHDFRRLRARRLYGWRSFRVRRGTA